MPPLILPLLHPSAVLQGQAAEEPAQVAALKRVADYLNGVPPCLQQDSPPPNSFLRPTLGCLRAFNVDRSKFDTLAIDIENAGEFITVIGITQLSMRLGIVGRSISLPFRTQGGENYWQHWVQHCAAVEWLYDLLADETRAKVFHNGVSHDVLMLERHGFKVRGDLWDTLIMQHYCYPEMRKALQYCATLYLGAPVWKDLLDEDDEKETEK